MPLVKAYALMRRRADYDLQTFSHHWRTTHRALAMRVVDVGLTRGYVQNHRVQAGLAAMSSDVDGVVEIWVQSPESLREFARCEAYRQGAYLDEPNFMADRPTMMVGDETVIIPGPRRQDATSLFKLMTFVRWPPGAARHKALEGWKTAQAPVLIPTALPAKLIRFTALDGEGTGFADMPFDAIEMSWWRTLPELRQAWARRIDSVHAASIPDCSTLSVLVREEPVVWPALHCSPASSLR